VLARRAAAVATVEAIAAVAAEVAGVVTPGLCIAAVPLDNAIHEMGPGGHAPRLAGAGGLGAVAPQPR
jgi:hypothetical protein